MTHRRLFHSLAFVAVFGVASGESCDEEDRSRVATVICDAAGMAVAGEAAPGSCFELAYRCGTDTAEREPILFHESGIAPVGSWPAGFTLEAGPGDEDTATAHLCVGASASPDTAETLTYQFEAEAPNEIRAWVQRTIEVSVRHFAPWSVDLVGQGNSFAGRDFDITLYVYGASASPNTVGWRTELVDESFCEMDRGRGIGGTQFLWSTESFTAVDTEGDYSLAHTISSAVIGCLRVEARVLGVASMNSAVTFVMFAQQPVNSPPELRAVIELSGFEEGSTQLVLDGSKSGPPGVIATYQWRLSINYEGTVFIPIELDPALASRSFLTVPRRCNVGETYRVELEVVAADGETRETETESRRIRP